MIAEHKTQYDYDPSVVTKMIMSLFDHWKITYEQMALLLSLSERSRNSIANYKKGQTALSLNRDACDRVGNLLAIHQALRTIFPKNIELAYQWPITRNKAFNNQTPVEFMIDEGFNGPVKVRQYLEHYLAG